MSECVGAAVCVCVCVCVCVRAREQCLMNFILTCVFPVGSDYKLMHEFDRCEYMYVCDVCVVMYVCDVCV